MNKTTISLLPGVDEHCTEKIISCIQIDESSQQNDTVSESGQIRKERILSLSDKLLDKIEMSINEIDRTILKTKEKIKSVEYDYDLKKPITENVEEKENIEVIEGMIDKSGLKQLVSTLKDIKDIQLSIENENVFDEDDECGVVVLGNVDESTLEGEDDF